MIYDDRPVYPPEYDEMPYCDVCGLGADAECVCEPCTVCESVGDLNCYKNHGQTLTKEQTDARERADEREKKQRKSDCEYADSLLAEIDRTGEKQS
jgi:hypothetical protein